MKNLPIIGKFLAIIGVFGVFAIGVAVYATSQMRSIDTTYSALADHEETGALMVSKANRALNTVNAAIADLMISTSDADNRKALDRIAAARHEFETYMTKAIALLPAKTDLPGLKAAALTVMDRSCSRSIRAGSSATAPAEVLLAQQGYLAECSSEFVPITTAYRTVADSLQNEAQAGGDRLTVLTGNTIAITFGVILGGLALVAGLAYFGVRAWIVAPILNMSTTMGVIASGETDIDIPCRFRKDELGKMGVALETFRLAAIDKVRLEAAAVEQRMLADSERGKTETARAAGARALALVVESVGQGLSKLAEGDLMFRLEASFAAEYESLRRDFNGAMEKLRETITVVSTNSAAITSGSGEITTAADDLSRRTEQQAASLEETAAALDEITATVRKTADGAIHARDVVGGAKTDAERSGEIVREAVTAMSGIEKSSGQIGQIIGVIDEIAFQTNLLALNAGVEAARAGDSGRGFAVVASEVRALAQRSAEAAKEIKGLISASGQHVSSGVRLVSEAGQALTRIVSQVAEINSVVGEIAASAQEQATALNQVNTAVNQMDQVTQQNAAMVEETTAASHSLAHEAQQLDKLIARFNTGGGAPIQTYRQSPPARPAPAPTRTTMKTTGFGGAARKPTPELEPDSWEEF